MVVSSFVSASLPWALLLLSFCGPSPTAFSLHSTASGVQSRGRCSLIRGGPVSQLCAVPDTQTEAGSQTDRDLSRLQGRLMKQLRQTCREFGMIEPNDHIMVCVSGGKDSATLLVLLQHLQQSLAPVVPFRLTAVHLDQQQPGYNGEPLVSWLESLGVPFRILSEDTYSVVKEKVPEGKTYCSLCSRLRRGILYTAAEEIGANKIALGHHADDAIETLFLNMIHQGQTKGMPARYVSESRGGIHVLRPLIRCLESDIAEFARRGGFPILPCTLCGSQPDAQRQKVKLLCATLESLSVNAKRNLVSAMGDVRPSHLLDKGLREAAGLDPLSGLSVAPRGRLVKGIERASEGHFELHVPGEDVAVLEGGGEEDGGKEGTTGGLLKSLQLVEVTGGLHKKQALSGATQKEERRIILPESEAMQGSSVLTNLGSVQTVQNGAALPVSRGQETTPSFLESNSDSPGKSMSRARPQKPPTRAPSR